MMIYGMNFYLVPYEFVILLYVNFKKLLSVKF